MKKFILIIPFILLLNCLSLAEEKVSFNFVDVELPVIAKFVSEVTGKNIIFDERLKGRITIIAPSPITISDAFGLFTSVLELKGFTLVPAGVNAYKIMPTVIARQKGLRVTEKVQMRDEYVVKIIKLKNITSNDAIRLLSPIISKDGYISELSSGNLILVVDSLTNIAKLTKIIEIIDQPSTLELPEIVFLKYAPAEDVAKILNEGFSDTRFKPGQKRQTTKAVPDKRLNAVVIFGPEKTRKAMKALLRVLDSPSSEDQSRIHVYFLENADAEEIAEVLNGIIKGLKGKKAKTPKEKTQELTSEIVVTADKATNSLVILASPSEYKALLEVIKKLDKRRRQVYVEAMIVEASIDKLRELGARWRAAATKDNNPIFISGFGAVDPGTIQNLLYGLSGLSMGGMGNFLEIPVVSVDQQGRLSEHTLTLPGFAALFSLNEFRGAVNVLSTPQILTSDNEEAEIVVGENVPFITRRESDPTRTVSVFSTIERKDVGITLRITPQITEGDYVKLEIYQEISSLKQDSNTEVLISVGPTTTKRATKTSVVVKDGHTVVIGGLMQEREEETFNKVPLLGDIPLLGYAFRFEGKTKKKTNLLVFLTPHIIRDSKGLVKITQKKKEEFLRKVHKHQILVKFKEGTDEEQILNIVQARGDRIIKILKELDIYLIEIKDKTIREALKYYRSLPIVEYAEPNYPRQLQ